MNGCAKVKKENNREGENGKEKAAERRKQTNGMGKEREMMGKEKKGQGKERKEEENIRKGELLRRNTREQG